MVVKNRYLLIFIREINFEFMKLSVVVPTLNRLEYLKITLKHLMPQIKRNLNNVELCISINASGDDTEAYIKSLKDENSFINYKSFTKRVEICESFSRSIDLCNGDYIMIFGDDDIAAPYMIESILEVLDNSLNIGLIHFNRLVGSDVGLTLMNKLRLEQPNYDSVIENNNLSNFIKKYTVSPGFISALVFKKEAWDLGEYFDTSNHFGYDFLGRIFAGIHKLTLANCLYISYPLVIQRMVKNREWNDTWPKYWLVGVPNLLQSFDKSKITDNAMNTWHKELNISWIKLIYTLLWASTYKDKYKPLVPQIQKYQGSLLRKLAVFTVINFSPSFVFKQIRKYLYK